MKYTAILGCALMLTTIAGCNKNTTGNKGIVRAENAATQNSDQQMSEDSLTDSSEGSTYTNRYVAEDGSSALVTFDNSKAEKTISIRSNNKTITAPQKESWRDGGVYGQHDFEITTKKDTIIITQGNNVITLKKAREN